MILNDPDFTFTFILVAIVFSVSVVTALIVGFVDRFTVLRSIVTAVLVLLVTGVAGGIGYYVDHNTYEIDAVIEIEEGYDVELYSVTGERIAGSQSDVDIFENETTEVSFVYDQTLFEGATLVRDQTEDGVRFTLMVEAADYEEENELGMKEFSAEDEQPLEMAEPGEILESD